MASFEIAKLEDIKKFEEKIIFNEYAKWEIKEDSYKTLAYVSISGNSKIYDTTITKKDGIITGVIQAGNWPLKDIKNIIIAPVVLIRVFEYKNGTDITDEVVISKKSTIFEKIKNIPSLFLGQANSSNEATVTVLREAKWITKLIGTDSISDEYQHFLVCNNTGKLYLLVMLDPMRYAPKGKGDRTPQSISDFQKKTDFKPEEEVEEVSLSNFFNENTGNNNMKENIFSDKHRIRNFVKEETNNILTKNGAFLNVKYTDLKELWEKLNVNTYDGYSVEISLNDQQIADSKIAWESSRIDKLERELDLLIDTLAPPFVETENGQNEVLGYCPQKSVEAQFLQSGNKIKMLGDKLLDSPSDGVEVKWPSQYRLPRYLLPPNESDSIDDSKNVWIQIFKDYLNQSNLSADSAITNWNKMWSIKRIKTAFTTPLSEIITHITDPVIR